MAFPVEPAVWVAFAGASLLLILTPGPMVAFIATTALTRGLAAALYAVAGSTLALGLHLSVVALGLTTVLAFAGEAFFWLKLLGALYLLYLAMAAWRAPAPEFEPASATPPARGRAFVEGFFVNLTNPKVLLFQAAFLPLFVSPERPAGPQLAVFAATFLLIAATFDSLWALGADRARPAFRRLGGAMNKISAGVLLVAAAALAGARRSS